MRKWSLIFLSIGITLLANCGGGATSPSAQVSRNGQTVLQSIQVIPSQVAIAPGTNQAFTARGTYSDGSTKDLTLMVQWSCPGTAAATVSDVSPTQGMATGLAPGTAVVTASFNGISNNAVLTVKNVNVSSLVVSPATATMGWGNQQQFTATATFTDNSRQDVTNATSWSSSYPFITAGSGLAIGRAVAANGVQAFFGSAGGSAQLTVDLSNLTSISVSPAMAAAADHTDYQFGALGIFVDGSTRDVTNLVTWSSSNGGVADFDSSEAGLITCTKPGTTTITATAGSIDGSTTLNVNSVVLRSLSMFPANPSPAPGVKIAMSAIGVFADSSTQDMTNQVKWSTSSSKIASVTSSGIVTGGSAGAATITATSVSALGSVQQSTAVTVTAATLNSIAVTPANTFIAPANALPFTALGTFSDGSKQDVSLATSWSSDLVNVATVKPTGTVTGQGLGDALITSKLGAIRGSTYLSVASPTQIAIAIAPSGTQVAQQTSVQLSAQGTLTGGGKQDLTTAVNWTSSSPTVATVGWQSGIVTGLTPGQATITATLGTVSTKIQVKVTDATLTSITLTPATPSIPLGSSQQFTATGKFSDGTDEALAGASWTSSDSTIAAINNSGLANSTGTGSATITATVNGVNGSTNLTVQ